VANCCEYLSHCVVVRGYDLARGLGALAVRSAPQPVARHRLADDALPARTQGPDPWRVRVPLRSPSRRLGLWPLPGLPGGRGLDAMPEVQAAGAQPA